MIPARLDARRLPGKALLDDTGQPLIHYAIRAARQARSVKHVIVATDSMKIANAVAGMAVCWVDQDDDSWCGSQRVARSLIKLPERYAQTDVIVNLQADEPEVDAETIERIVQAADRLDEYADFVTVVAPYDRAAHRNPTITKAMLTSRDGPTVRDFLRLTEEDPCHRPHVGVYAMRPERMAELVAMPPSSRSIAESLEQLTWIDDGWRCEAIQITYSPMGINTPEDYARFVQRHARDRE